MINAKEYVDQSFYGNKEKAVQELEKWVKMYEESPRYNLPKIQKRISDYKDLILEIKSL